MEEEEINNNDKVSNRLNLLNTQHPKYYTKWEMIHQLSSFIVILISYTKP
jgi:hypothetical protein